MPGRRRSKEKKMIAILRKLHREESGQDMIEYALVAALIAFGATTTMTSLASTINSAYSLIGSKLSSAIS